MTTGLTEDGCLVTDADGNAVFEGLYPGLMYRVTEVEAPEGYILLADYAFAGELPVDTLEVALNVKNSQTYWFPDTGAEENGVIVIGGTMLVMMALAAGTVFVCQTAAKKRKKQTEK